jgi:hypothetical protein
MEFAFLITGDNGGFDDESGTDAKIARPRRLLL